MMMRKRLTDKVNLMLDSGAFSSWRKGVDIDLDRYIDYVKWRQGMVTTCINLDVIPARFGQKPSPQQVEESATKGWENLIRMEDAGLNPMPVFHQGENYKWLDKMIEKYDYIGISPANDKVMFQRREWLDDVFSAITDSRGHPVVDTHGFGVTALTLMFRYPFTTCDSLTWLVIAIYGGILVPPPFFDGKYDFTKPPFTIFTSSRQQSLKGVDAIDVLSVGVREYVENYLTYIEMDLDQVRIHYKGRCRANLRYFKRVEEQFRPVQFMYKRAKGFF